MPHAKRNTDTIKHKKECEEHVRLAAEHAAKLHDEKLFKQPPPQEDDCPICFIRIPYLGSGSAYMACCGKVICSGCGYAPVYDNQGNKVSKKTCPFCRTPHNTYATYIKRLKERVEVDDARATYNLGCLYNEGSYGLPQDQTKALELFYRAVELDHTASHNFIGYAYDKGRGVEVDKEKATYYYELAAMGGCVYARHNLGVDEENQGNMNRALKHYMIAASGGYHGSLKFIKEFYTDGYATKEDYTKALQLYQAYLGEIKSDLRDKAAAAREDHRYY